MPVNHGVREGYLAQHFIPLRRLFWVPEVQLFSIGNFANLMQISQYDRVCYNPDGTRKVCFGTN